MAKTSGGTRTSTSRNPRGLNESSTRNSGGDYLNSIPKDDFGNPDFFKADRETLFKIGESIDPLKAVGGDEMDLQEYAGRMEEMFMEELTEKERKRLEKISGKMERYFD